jgi:prephenate dehydrogenase
VRVLDPAIHDRIFAAVSHLPHVLAFALVDLLAARPTRPSVFRLRGERLSRFHAHRGGSPEMWRDISLANRDALLTEIDEYRAELDRIAAMVVAGRRYGARGLFHACLGGAPRMGSALRPRVRRVAADGPREP